MEELFRLFSLDLVVVVPEVLAAEHAVAVALESALDAVVLLEAGEVQLRLSPALRLAHPPFAEGHPRVRVPATWIIYSPSNIYNPMPQTQLNHSKHTKNL